MIPAEGLRKSEQKKYGIPFTVLPSQNSGKKKKKKWGPIFAHDFCFARTFFSA
jgi:hypothetical protein